MCLVSDISTDDTGAIGDWFVSDLRRPKHSKKSKGTICGAMEQWSGRSMVDIHTYIYIYCIIIYIYACLTTCDICVFEPKVYVHQWAGCKGWMARKRRGESRANRPRMAYSSRVSGDSGYFWILSVLSSQSRKSLTYAYWDHNMFVIFLDSCLGKFYIFEEYWSWMGT